MLLSQGTRDTIFSARTSLRTLRKGLLNEIDLKQRVNKRVRMWTYEKETHKNHGAA